MMAMQIYAAACSNKGCVRKNNEDNFFLNGRFMQSNERDNGGLYTTSRISAAKTAPTLARAVWSRIHRKNCWIMRRSALATAVSAL